MIIVRTLRRDIARYNRDDDLVGSSSLFCVRLDLPYCLYRVPVGKSWKTRGCSNADWLAFVRFVRRHL